MRLWSVHPRYLDSKGLVACWREALLAQAVLLGRTRGYQNHPQLDRFKRARDPVSAVGAYLRGIQAEAVVRGYSFDAGKVKRPAARVVLQVTRKQLAFEWAHLRSKLAARDLARHKALPKQPAAHPMFKVVPGPIADWEKT